MEDYLVIGYDEGKEDYACLTVARKTISGQINIITTHYGQEAIDTYNFLSGRLVKSE